MCTIHRLKIGLGIPKQSCTAAIQEPSSVFKWVRSDHIPIAVIQDNYVGTREVDTQATGTCGEEKDEFFRPRAIILID